MFEPRIAGQGDEEKDNKEWEEDDEKMIKQRNIQQLIILAVDLGLIIQTYKHPLRRHFHGELVHFSIDAMAVFVANM